MNAEKAIVISMKNIDPTARNRIMNEFLEEYNSKVYLLCCGTCNALGCRPRDLSHEPLGFTVCALCGADFCEKCKRPSGEMCDECVEEHMKEMYGDLGW